MSTTRQISLEQADILSEDIKKRISDLYQDAVRSADEARSHLRTSDLRTRCRAFDGLQNLLRQIKSTTDAYIDPELATGHSARYEQCVAHVIKSRVYLDLQALDAAVSILNELRQMWEK